MEGANVPEQRGFVTCAVSPVSFTFTLAVLLLVTFDRGGLGRCQVEALNSWMMDKQ